MSGAGGEFIGMPGGPDGMTRFPGQNGPQMGMPVERGNPIDQPIFGFNPDFNPRNVDPGFNGGPNFDQMPSPGFGGGKGGIGIDPTPIQGPGGGGGDGGPGLDHLKDYGPVVDQMKQYVQSMSGLIDQINSKF